MGAMTFYKNCRESGLKLTLGDAEAMREAWIKTFKEMSLHMQAQPAKNMRLSAAMYGMERQQDAEDEEEDSGKGKHNYMAKLVCGQMRNRCSWNSAANFHFQALTAICVKQAGWNLVLHGYGDRLSNMIHDEYVYWLWPNELQTHIPIIERLMLDAAAVWMPDINVSLETSCMLHWDKHATPYNELTYDESGLPILEEPPFVQELHKALEAQKESTHD